MTLTDLMLTHEEIETAVKSPSGIMWEAADAIAQAAAAKAAYAVLDELGRLTDVTLVSHSWADAVLLKDALREQLEAAGLPRRGFARQKAVARMKRNLPEKGKEKCHEARVLSPTVRRFGVVRHIN